MQREKGGRGLDHLPKLEPACNVGPGQKPIGEQRGHTSVRFGEEAKIALPPNELLEVRNDLEKSALQLLVLMRFTSVHKNRLEVIAHMNQPESEISLIAFLVVVEAD